MSISLPDYQFVCDLLRQRSGLSLGPGKQYLLESRLAPLLASWGDIEWAQFFAELRANPDSALGASVIEAMMIQETSFFRDRTPFLDLKARLVPHLLSVRARAHTLRIWCAAASTGQEPYSVAILLSESFPELEDWDVEILATDISATAVIRAEAGAFSQFEVQRGMDFRDLPRWFEQGPAGWQIKDPLRKKVRFRQRNLLESFDGLGTFDIVMCRHVLTYFDAELQRQLLERLYHVVRDDGFLMLGVGESACGITDRFRPSESCLSNTYTPVPRVLA